MVCERGTNSGYKSTFAKTPQFAQGGGKKRFNLRKNGPKREGWCRFWGDHVVNFWVFAHGGQARGAEQWQVENREARSEM